METYLKRLLSYTIMKIALYARVSKALEQNPENQLISLREWASKSGNIIEENMLMKYPLKILALTKNWF